MVRAVASQAGLTLVYDVVQARINSMNDLLAAHGITEGNILQFLAVRLSVSLSLD